MMSDSFNDLLPLSADRTAPGEYEIKSVDGRRLWYMEGRSLAEWVCEQINGNWRPIATAPKDGRRILLCEGEGITGFWDRDPKDECGQCWRGDGCERIEPTHWQPLPDPPGGEEESKANGRRRNDHGS